MERKKKIEHFRDLEVYRRAFEPAMRIFQLTKKFPPEEKFSLVDQIRRASRSVFHELDDEYEQLIAMLSAMEKQADKFCY